MALRYYTIFEDRERVAEAVECVLPTRWEFAAEQFEKSHWRFQDFHPSFEAGLEGRMEVLEAPMGFLELFGGKFPPGWENALDGFGDTLAILEYGVIPKRHPCCASTHKCLDAVIDLRNEHGFSAGDVESVHTTVGSSNARNLSYDDPQNAREAKFSMQYCIENLASRAFCGSS